MELSIDQIIDILESTVILRPTDELEKYRKYIPVLVQKYNNQVRELEELRDKMHKIKTWVEAYPLSIFPEPDFKKVNEILSQHGMTLDAISASNMRHVLNGIKDIIDI